MRTRSVSYEIIGILIEYATSINIDIQEIFKTIHFNPGLLKHPSARIPVNQYQTLWKKIVDKSKDKYFGLHFGESTNDFCRGNVMCAVMMNCPDIGVAIQKFIRYHSILSDLIIPKLIEDGDYAYFTWDNNIPDLTLDHHQNESNIIMLNSVLQCLSRATIDIIKIRFSHKQPDDITEHERIFNASLVFGCNRNEIIFKRDDLFKKIFLANPELLNANEKFVVELLNRLSEKKSGSDKVIRLLSNSLVSGTSLDIESVAHELASSTRKLQQKLKEEGNSYQKLYDQVRKEIALIHINKPDVSFYDVAFLLGFSEQSSFNHAFKRWTGSNPKEYKKKTNMFIL